MKKVVLAVAFTVAIVAGSIVTVNAAPNETKIEKKNYQIPPNG